MTAHVSYFWSDCGTRVCDSNNAYELAFRMQTAAPELQNISAESLEIQKLYGLDDPVTEDFDRQC